MSYVVALIACHNRKDRTVACLTSLFSQHVAGHYIEAVLIDDGSSDGTADAARAVSERVDVIRGDGSLFWAGAMALAEQRAMSRLPDYLLWLNDDVVLYGDAIETLMAARDSSTNGQIVVGTLVDPDTGVPTYGGVERADWHPLRFRLVAPTDGEPRPVSTFNGNVVLVARAVYRRVGGIDGGFSHAYADIDYGLRAGGLGIHAVVSGTPVGTCPRGPGAPWRDTSLPLTTRYRLMLSRKGVPIGSSARYLRRHGGRLWPVYFLATYVKLAVDHASAWHLRGRIPSQ